jgi:hypothetical protein
VNHSQTLGYEAAVSLFGVDPYSMYMTSHPMKP